MKDHKIIFLQVEDDEVSWCQNRIFDIDDNDICDAFSLMKFGECFFDETKCINKHQLECIERFKGKNLWL